MGQLVACGTAEGQRWYWLTQDRQVLLQLLSHPVQSTLDTVAMSPGSFSSSASSTWLPWKRGLQLRSQCQGSQAQAEKRKKLIPAPTLQSLGLLPLPSEKEPGQSIHHHLPWTQPKTIQWSSKSWS